MLHAHDPAELRLSDPARYLALSRQVTGEAMAEVLGEWRRAASPCGGGLVLWLRDLQPGAGWGVLDHRGEPKVAWHHLRRALAPVAVWTSDEQLNGIAVHIANDGPQPLRARLRVTLYAAGERRVEEAVEALELPAATTIERNVEGLLGHFVDASWAYRFGPAAHDVVVASLEREGPDGVELLSQAMRFVTGRPRERFDADALGLRASASRGEGGRAGEGSGADDTRVLTISARRLVYGLRIAAEGWRPDDDALNLEPGATRTLRLRPAAAGQAPAPLTLSALNLAGTVTVGAPR
jgi:beta-mannosidase